MTLWPTTAPNFRAELARYKIPQSRLAELIRMHPKMLCMSLNELRPMTPEVQHNIGWGINKLARRRVFAVDPAIPLVKLRAGAPKLHKPKGIKHYPLLPND